MNRRYRSSTVLESLESDSFFEQSSDEEILDQAIEEAIADLFTSSPASSQPMLRGSESRYEDDLDAMIDLAAPRGRREPGGGSGSDQVLHALRFIREQILEALNLLDQGRREQARIQIDGTIRNIDDIPIRVRRQGMPPMALNLVRRNLDRARVWLRPGITLDVRITRVSLCAALRRLQEAMDDRTGRRDDEMWGRINNLCPPTNM